MLRGFMNYYGVSGSTRLQLGYLDHLIYKRFRRLLIQKHLSKPKRGTFIFSTYFNSGYLGLGSIKLLRTSDIHPFGNIPMHLIAPSLEYLKSHVYLDKFSQNEHKFKMQKLAVLQSLRHKRKLSVKDFKLALFLVQKGICGLCGEELLKDKFLDVNYAEIDHNPRVHVLKEEAGIALLEKRCFQETNSPESINSVAYNDICQEIILATLHKVDTSLVHKTCNTEDARCSRTESAQTRKRIINYYGKDRYNHIYKPFVKIVQSRIRNKKNLSKTQMTRLFV